jgi:L-seryl-tRNA(Ser) seleniumtransferase
VIAITSKSISVQNLEKRFRENTPPIIARIHKDQLRIDLRTVDESEEEYLIATITSL